MKDKNAPRETPQESPDTEENRIDWKAEIISWIQILVIAALAAFILDTFIIANSRIPSGSMENTIMTNDRVIGSRLSYRFGDPERGDVAIFIYGYECRECELSYQETPDGVCPRCGRSDRRNSKIYYVKRIIGLPGDTVDIHDGHVYLNGSDEPYDEPYLKEAMLTPQALHYEVPEGCYLMLGDNRNWSADARFWQYTYIHKEKIIAKVLFRYFPRIGWIK